MSFTAAAKVFILFGDPVAHSLSPVMQNAALQAAGIDGLYIPWRVQSTDLPTAFESIRRMENFGGANVTIPHKEQAFTLVDTLTPEAAAVGAINTVVSKDGRLLGANTDGPGFIRSLHEGADFLPRGKPVVILGAGGAARAVAVSLAGAGAAPIVIINRTAERAQSLTEFIHGTIGATALGLGLDDPRTPTSVRDCALVVNTTSVGLHPTDPSPIDPHLLQPGVVVYDLIYRPRETALLREAKRRGCRVVGGLGMLLYQGALAFELWTGIEPSEAAMRQALVTAVA
ncbi:shikimate dehydrogenase [Candidatus Methylomirabilis lanthanidiphila]|uniref:Shikimate dehydrogenase (NADP(+)) n=1 Tax=Candidatus Methylomirabilis lanthanidiphila TaxID=2211376 RepID=A0A564ZGG6_9BACT|nr:shikimate dehydrogenase [Candidatus Methylomirabilis lanthanidiphila]VUZ83648.1 shikimate dehydrogenase [Candidatus Methylomirabilis lanthanidiphila]